MDEAESPPRSNGRARHAHKGTHEEGMQETREMHEAGPRPIKMEAVSSVKQCLHQETGGMPLWGSGVRGFGGSGVRGFGFGF
jgi:hypothetical protein